MYLRQTERCHRPTIRPCAPLFRSLVDESHVTRILIIILLILMLMLMLMLIPPQGQGQSRRLSAFVARRSTFETFGGTGTVDGGLGGQRLAIRRAMLFPIPHSHSPVFQHPGPLLLAPYHFSPASPLHPSNISPPLLLSLIPPLYPVLDQR